MKHGWTGVIAGVMLGVGLGCRQEPSPQAVVPDTTPSSAQVLTHFQMQDIQAGTLYMTLDSEEGQLFEKPSVTDLTQPVATFYKNNVLSSVMRAPLGRVFMDTHELLAWGGVTVVTADSSTLTTEHMRYDPKLRKLFSEDDVRLEKPDSITVGHGLESDVDLSHVKIGHEKVTLKNSQTSKPGP